MPFNPTTGVFTRVDNTFSDPVTGTLIDPIDADGLFDDYDAGLTASHTFTQTGTGAVPVAVTSIFQSKIYTPFMFGAVGNGVADDTAAIQRAIDALPFHGGAVDFPAGYDFLCASSLTITGQSVTLRGATNQNEDFFSPSITYSGTGTRFIDARDSRGFKLEGLRVQYSSASFTGSLVDLSGLTPGTTVSALASVIDCMLAPTTDRVGTATLLNMGGTVGANIERNFLRRGAPAVLGQAIIGQNTCTTLRQNLFLLSDTTPISEGGEAWILDGNIFENCADGTGKAFVNTASLPCKGMIWTGNWFGDVATGPGTLWIDAYLQGAVFQGNQIAGHSSISGVGIRLHSSSGVQISGNYFQYLTAAVDCATASTGLKMGTNTYLNVTTPITNASNCIADDFTLASTGITAISPQAVTYAKFQNLPAASLFGNSGALGVGQAIPVGGGFDFVGSTLARSALTGDITASLGSNTTTLATVNSNVGTFGSATQSVQFTVNGKGLMTAAANVTITPAIGSITGLGTGVSGAAANNIGSAGAFVTFNGAGGTPSSIVLTNATGIAAGLTAGHVTTNADLTGDVTSSGNATVIGANKVTRTMQAQGVARSVIGVAGNATANVADIQGTASQFLGVNSAGTALAFQTMSGDATLSGGALTLGTNVVTNAKAAQMAANTFKANNTAGTANSADITATQAAAMLAVVGGVLNSKVLSTTYNLATASGTQDINGAGFQPNSIIILSAVGGGNDAMSFGIVDSVAGQNSLKIFSDALVPAPQASAAIIYQNSAATASQTGVVSYLPDGIRITWTKVGSPTGTLTIYALCFR